MTGRGVPPWISDVRFREARRQEGKSWRRIDHRGAVSRAILAAGRDKRRVQLEHLTRISRRQLWSAQLNTSPSDSRATGTHAQPQPPNGKKRTSDVGEEEQVDFEEESIWTGGSCT